MGLSAFSFSASLRTPTPCLGGYSRPGWVLSRERTGQNGQLVPQAQCLAWWTGLFKPRWPCSRLSHTRAGKVIFLVSACWVFISLWLSSCITCITIWTFCIRRYRPSQRSGLRHTLRIRISVFPVLFHSVRSVMGGFQKIPGVRACFTGAVQDRFMFLWCTGPKKLSHDHRSSCSLQLFFNIFAF